MFVLEFHTAVSCGCVSTTGITGGASSSSAIVVSTPFTGEYSSSRLPNYTNSRVAEIHTTRSSSPSILLRLKVVTRPST